MADEVDNIDTRFTPSIHPATVQSIDGYDDDDVRPYLGQAEAVFSAAYIAIRDIHDAKESIATDSSLNESARLLAVDSFASKRMASVTSSWDRVSASTSKTIAALEAELNAPVEEIASKSQAEEIRRFCIALPSTARLGFIEKAIDKGDAKTVGATLGGPAYLVGIEDETQQALLRHWHEKSSPTTAKRLRALTAAKDMLDNKSGLVLVAWQDAVGFIEQTKEVRHGNTTKTMVVGKLYASDIRKQKVEAQKPFLRGL